MHNACVILQKLNVTEAIQTQTKLPKESLIPVLAFDLITRTWTFNTKTQMHNFNYKINVNIIQDAVEKINLLIWRL